MTFEQEVDQELADEVEHLTEEDALRSGPPIQPEYEALGIHPDTMTCVAVLSEKDAKEYVWSLAKIGIHAIASRDGADKKLWHVAVLGGLAYNPAAYFASITGENAGTCMSTAASQHPLVLKENE